MEQRPGAVQRGHVREIETVTENPDAEPVTPCESAKTAIVVYGKQLGRKLTVCTDKHCPVHDPQTAAEAAAHPVPAMAPAPEAETEEEAAERQAEFERQRAEYEEERQRREEERKQQFEREQAEIEAERNRRAEILKVRQATFERIIEEAPPAFNPAQMRVLLRALINLDPYTFADDLAEDIAADNENEQRSAEGVLLSAIDATADDKLTRFALRLALAGHIGIPREGDFDFLTEAETVFVPPQPTKKTAAKKAKQPTPVNSPAKGAPKPKAQRAPSNKKIAA
jgi:ParB family chromosome partitioning protein